jgi:tRNA(Ile)-lysidine synthase
MELLKKVHETIKKYSMLSEGDNILLGLSGGPDSVCLGFILHELRGDFNLIINAIYIDHGLRPDEVKEEIEFCKTFCNRLDISFYTKSIDVKGYAKDKHLGHQEAARELRYQVYEEVSREVDATKIALGHTADDQAETFLMRVLRGSGLRGLSGIPPVRGKIIRPLIEVGRREIERFLLHNYELMNLDSKLPYKIDSSNLRTDYLRNWVRHKVIPELRQHNPSLIKTICRTADILREEDEYLELIVSRKLKGLVSKRTEDTIELFLSPLEIMEKPILRRVLRRAINDTEGLRGVDFIHIEDVINLIKDGKAGDRLCLPQGVRIIKSYSTLILTKESVKTLKSREFIPPGDLFLDEVSISLRAEMLQTPIEHFDGKNTAVFDLDRLSLPLTVRSRRRGDFFYPLGLGKKKKLQDFFVDSKIPRDERDAIPVVVSGEDIIWIVGYRMDERFKAGKDTKRFLIIKKIFT